MSDIRKDDVDDLQSALPHLAQPVAPQFYFMLAIAEYEI